MGIVGIMVCAIMIGGAFLPAISSANIMAGDPITEYNEGTGQTYREARAGDVLKLIGTYDTEAGKGVYNWTLNGDVVLNDWSDNLEHNVIIYSDVFWAYSYNATNPSAARVQFLNDATLYYVPVSANNPSAEWTLTFTDTTISWALTSGGTLPAEYTTEYTWAYIPCTVSEGAYLSSTVTGENYPCILKNYKDVVLCGTFETGTLDTGYYYHKGEARVFVEGLTGTYTPTITPRDGTTDLYDVVIEFTVSDGSTTESFNPYKALVPYEVHGHGEGNAIQNMIGVLPIVAIAGLVMAGIYVFISRK